VDSLRALDVSMQAQILNLMMDLQEERGLTYMFITHNLSVVKHISNEIAVMYLGQCVERTYSEELFRKPMHPYTRALLDAILVPRLSGNTKMKGVIKSEVTSPVNPKPGCRFAVRCPKTKSICKGKNVELKEIESGHFVACTLY